MYELLPNIILKIIIGQYSDGSMLNYTQQFFYAIKNQLINQQVKLKYFHSLFQKTFMDFITSYGMDTNYRQLTYLQHKILPIYLIKIMSKLKRQLKKKYITFSDQCQSIFQHNSPSKTIQIIKSQQSEKKLQLSSIEFYYITTLDNLKTQLYIKVIVYLETGLIKITSTPLINGSIYFIRYKPNIQSINRFIIGYNSKLKNCFIQMHPSLGQIWITTTNQMNHQSLKKLLLKPDKFYCNIYLNSLIMEKHWNFLFLKILFFSNQNIDATNNPSLRQLISNIEKQTQQIINQIKISHIQIPFIYQNHQKLKFEPLKTQELLMKKRQYERLENCMRYNDYQLNRQIIKILELYLGRKISEKQNCKFQISEKTKNDIQKNLSKTNFKYKYPIHSKFIKQEIVDLKQITNSELSVIMLMDITGRKPEDHKITFNKFIKKIAQQSRLQNQKKIIQSIKNKYCMFIPRYFQVQGCQNSIISQYCPNRSIDFYMLSYQQFLSLQTKLFFIYQIIHGLRFLRDNGIVHLDVKPPNILLKTASNKNQEKHSCMLAKLIDFGESINNNNGYNSQNMVQKGYTIPYASPELVRKSNRFNQKSDVFSIGIIILEFIFYHGTPELRRIGKQVFLNQEYFKFYTICVEKCKMFGLSNVMQLLYFLSLRCIHPVPKFRPSLDWLTVIIQLSLNCFKNHFI